MNPLSVGNVVSAGLRIYRDNFKKYFKLAFIGYLWIVVPIYGWAKYSAMMGLISRLACREITEQPETIRDAQRFTKSKMWDFLVAGLLVSIIVFGAIIPVSLILGIVAGIVGSVFNSTTGAIAFIIIAFLLLIFAIVWLISRLFIVELPLAMEQNVTATSTIGRSWNLTKGSVGRVQLVVLIGFLISSPILLVNYAVSFGLQIAINIVLENAPAFAAIGTIIYLVLIFIMGALIIPFWQAIKAVVYCDLRVRREGMGIDLRK